MSVAKKIQTGIQHESELWNHRILIVDDEKAIAESYKDILCPEDDNVIPMSSRSSRSKTKPLDVEQLGYKFKLVVVYSAEEALKAVKKSVLEGAPFAMGFFDVKLGSGIDGVELVKEIRKLSPDMLTVFVTAHNDRTIESIQNILGKNHANKWDYLSKPFSRGEIIQKARNFTSLWNLNKQREIHEQQILTLSDRLLGMERTNSASAVARGVGHEFGNILMQIMGKAELSLNKNEEGMRLGLEKVVEASQRAMEILDRFKDLTDHGDLELQKQSCSLREIIHGTLDLMEHQIKISGLKINLNTDSDYDVWANSTSLMQVLVNLIINANHAMGNGGRIDICISSESDDVIMTFRDYGPGIADELLYKVTEPLFSTKGEKGTGLGLAICKEIIEIEHRGSFKLKNHSNGGLVVEVKLSKLLRGS